jgi:hypothetical protein
LSVTCRAWPWLSSNATRGKQKSRQHSLGSHRTNGRISTYRRVADIKPAGVPHQSLRTVWRKHLESVGREEVRNARPADHVHEGEDGALPWVQDDGPYRMAGRLLDAHSDQVCMHVEQPYSGKAPQVTRRRSHVAKAEIPGPVAGEASATDKVEPQVRLLAKVITDSFAVKTPRRRAPYSRHLMGSRTGQPSTVHKRLTSSCASRL